MSSLAQLPKLAGFFSYSRRDDQLSDGALSRLRVRILDELRLQLGRELKLWQDTAAIPEGSMWAEEITGAIEESVFFIPIVTPSAVGSKHCQFEFKSFLKREAALGRRNLVFPLLYVRVPALDHEEQWRADEVLTVVGERQYIDWQNFRHRDLREPEIARKIELYCRNIVESLCQPWMSPEERAAEEQRRQRIKAEEEARRRAEDDERARQAEEQRRAQERARLAHEAERLAQRHTETEERRATEIVNEKPKAQDSARAQPAYSAAAPGARPASRGGPMFAELMNFAYQRTALQAFGWYLTFFVIGIILGATTGYIVGIVAPSPDGSLERSILSGAIVVIPYHIILAVALLWSRWTGALNVFLAIGAVVLSAFLGTLGGLIPLAVLTTRPPKKEPTQIGAVFE